MITTKFNIGQKVRHKMLGFLGIIVDVDPEYSLSEPDINDMLGNESLRATPWYYVVVEDNDQQAVHTYYLAEAQLTGEIQAEYQDQPSLDELANTIRERWSTPHIRH